MEYFALQTVLGVMLATYLVSYGLVKYGKITLVNHRKFWNVILATAFLLTAISGIYNAIQINYGINLVKIDVIRIHGNFGLAMAVVALFHAAWHWPYFKGLVAKPEVKPPVQQ